MSEPTEIRPGRQKTSERYAKVRRGLGLCQLPDQEVKVERKAQAPFLACKPSSCARWTWAQNGPKTSGDLSNIRQHTNLGLPAGRDPAARSAKLIITWLFMPHFSPADIHGEDQSISMALLRSTCRIPVRPNASTEKPSSLSITFILGMVNIA
jgi:hypothetical protein